MTDLAHLYHDVILDHGRNPRNRRQLDNSTHTAIGDNPLCGDRIELSLVIDGETIKEAAFTGQGCAICLASTSVMTGEIMDKTIVGAKKIMEDFRDSLVLPPARGGKKGGGSSSVSEKLAAFKGVRTSPMRVKCALLPWHTLAKALGDQ